MTIAATADETWKSILDVESYSSYMACVRGVQVLTRDQAALRRTAWSVLLKGSILQWQQEERIDDVARCVRFSQLVGDLETYTGTWLVEPVPNGSRVTVAADFNIGIPLLADMLNPVAVSAFEENTRDMLVSIERQSSAGGVHVAETALQC